jgi:hypothetical protein
LTILKPVNILAKTLRKLIADHIIERRHLFNEVEALTFRAILEYLDPSAESKVLKSGDTIRADVIKYFEETKAIVAETLSTARSQIHLSFDL